MKAGSLRFRYCIRCRFVPSSHAPPLPRENPKMERARFPALVLQPKSKRHIRSCFTFRRSSAAKRQLNFSLRRFAVGPPAAARQIDLSHVRLLPELPHDPADDPESRKPYSSRKKFRAREFPCAAPQSLPARWTCPPSRRQSFLNSESRPAFRSSVLKAQRKRLGEQQCQVFSLRRARFRDTNSSTLASCRESADRSGRHSGRGGGSRPAN